MPDNLASLLQNLPPQKGTAIRQGVVESWDASTSDNAIRVAGGKLLNVPVLTSESMTLAVGDVVALLAAGDRWLMLGKVTTPGDPGTVPSWSADVETLTGQVDTIENVTIPAVQADVATAQTTATDAQTAADSAASDAALAASQSAAAQVDAATAIAKFPITETDVSDGAISTPKLAVGAVTAEILDADAVTGKTVTGGLFRTAVSGRRLEIDSADDTGQLTFYSNYASETAPANIQVQTSAFSGFLNIVAPATTGVPDPPALLLAGANTETDSQVNLTGPGNIYVGAGGGAVIEAGGNVSLYGSKLLFNDYPVQQGGPYIRCYQASALSMATGAYTDITNWTDQANDGFGSHGAGIFTLPETGEYFVSAGICFVGNPTAGATTGIRWAQLFSGGTSVALGTAGASNTGNVAQASFARQITGTAGGSLVLKGFQDSGTARNSTPGLSFTYIQIKYIGPS